MWTANLGTFATGSLSREVSGKKGEKRLQIMKYFQLVYGLIVNIKPLIAKTKQKNTPCVGKLLAIYHDGLLDVVNHVLSSRDSIPDCISHRSLNGSIHLQRGNKMAHKQQNKLARDSLIPQIYTSRCKL